MKKLLLIGGHIGSPQDVSPRAIKELQDADLILCERSKFFLELVATLQISVTENIIEVPSINEDVKSTIIDMLKNDKSVVFISDAGLPMIADPGIEISHFLFKNELDIDIVPGPSIVSTAHAVSAIDPFNSNFLFQEFMQYPDEAISPSLNILKSLPHTLVILDRPDRFIKNLAICLDVLGNRGGAIAINITEPDGQVIRNRLSKLLDYAVKTDLSSKNLTLIVAGNHSIDWKNLS